MSNFYILHGRRFAIAAEFADTEEGTKAANEHMEATGDTGLLAVADGRIILAKLSDKGLVVEAVAQAAAPKKEIRFMKHFVTDGTDKARVWYSLDNRVDQRECVTIYSKDYNSGLGNIIPDGYENNTDTMTDYFEKGRVVLFPGHPLYIAARARAEQSQR